MGGMLLWFVGGNIVVERHYRRRDISTWSKFNPFAFPFAHFNRREWLALGVMAAVSFPCIAAGLLGLA
jgi:hypothetical protein